jgi:3-oxoadipate enol-lactonase / 4-carboxymuconolactone decarboxylase
MNTNYTLQGTPNSPVLILSNSLGADLHMWDELVPYLLPFFRVLQYDTRGLGDSEATPDPYTIDLLGNDVIALLDQLNIQDACFCGLSMGGLIGQWLALNKPDRIKKIILSNTAAKIGDHTRWNTRIKTISDQGMNAIAEEMMERWFTEPFRQLHSVRVNSIRQSFIMSDPLGYCNCCMAIRDADFTNTISSILIPTLIISGDEDPVTTVDHAMYLNERIKDSKLIVLHAKHLSAAELPKIYAQALIDFLVGPSILEQGMYIRRTVLGDPHVDKANSNINSFNADFQQFISMYAWGEIWSRPGLSKYQRSFITIAMLIPLNRKAELKLHIKASLNNGLTISEIKEIILHAALYCGLPAANEAFHTAEEVFTELNLQYKI